MHALANHRSSGLEGWRKRCMAGQQARVVCGKADVLQGQPDSGHVLQA
jgi:hypothetical protein